MNEQMNLTFIYISIYTGTGRLQLACSKDSRCSPIANGPVEEADNKYPYIYIPM